MSARRTTGRARGPRGRQPAVSHQLAALERETRTALLRREARGVKLTPAGRAAVADARRAIEAAASAVRSARAVGVAAGGSLRLGCAQSLVSVLAPVVRTWYQRHPEVAITLRATCGLNWQGNGPAGQRQPDRVLVPLPRAVTSILWDPSWRRGGQLIRRPTAVPGLRGWCQRG
ncbi:MAG: LysR family transcriptional regulator [Trebonia sp.]